MLYDCNFRHTLIVQTPVIVLQKLVSLRKRKEEAAIRKFRNSLSVSEILSSVMFKIVRIFSAYIRLRNTPRQKSIRALEIFRVQKLILNATS